MSRSVVVITAVVLAAILAGALWYQLTTQPSSTSPSPTPSATNLATIVEVTPSVTPTASPLATFTPLTTIRPLRPTKQPNAVSPTAKTGPEDVALAAVVLAALGGSGLYLTLVRSGR